MADSAQNTKFRRVAGVPKGMLSDPIVQSVIWLNSFDKRRREYKKLGWVYVARNACFADPVFKIGQTRVSPIVRVEGLSSSTSVYQPFELVYFVHVSHRYEAENHVHKALASSRVNPAKEFFDAPIMTVVRALDEAANSWPIQLGKTPRYGYLGPALIPRVVVCRNCGGKCKMPRLLISIHVTCKHCSSGFNVISDVAG